ncbi:hypothetical protein CIB93_29140 [Streptomyces sp. WZ.A104]|nr:hypothetical protein CIB93_29140 [Streptomyces sp. WZ.A104]
MVAATAPSGPVHTCVADVGLARMGHMGTDLLRKFTSDRGKARSRRHITLSSEKRPIPLHKPFPREIWNTEERGMHPQE